jgi:hypothetical protein
VDVNSRRVNMMPGRRTAGAAVLAVAVTTVLGAAPAGATDPPCTRTGTNGDDKIRGTGGRDVICAMGGDDLIFPGGGDDLVRAGTGKDTVVYRSAEGAVRANLKEGLAIAAGTDHLRAVEGVLGSRFADVLLGDRDPNLLDGGGGADELSGRAGDDVLVGGEHADRLLGGTGDDVEEGGPGPDRMRGGPGRDACYQGSGGGPHTSCHPEDIPDGNDSRSPMDLARVHVETGPNPIWRLTTFREWSIGGARDRAFFLVLIDALGGDDPDYTALVRSNGAQMLGTLFRTGPGGEFAVASLGVWRPDGRSVSVRVPFSLLERDGSRLVDARTATARWQAETLFNGPGCRQTCFDLAPSFASVAMARPMST